MIVRKLKGLVLYMDMKINGNLQIQNEYKLNSKEINNSKELEQKSVVFSRNIDAFKKVASSMENNIYGANGTCKDEKVNQLQENTEKELKSANMMECIDTLKSMVTPEDYSQLEEWGLVPDEDNPEAFVTVYERIQIELMAYCEDYNMPGISGNQEKLKEVLGSDAAANAVSRVNELKSVGQLSDDTKKYILENNLAPTIDNVYKAVHSGTVNAATTSTLNLDNAQWQQLEPQVQSFFEKNGFENNGGNIENAKWIISNNLPLNVDNMNLVGDLNSVDFGDEEFVAGLEENIAKSVALGEDAVNVLVTGKDFDGSAIEEAVNTVKSAMDSDVDYILKNNQKLNIKNLKARVEARKKAEIDKNIQNKKESVYEEQSTNRILVEARAVLTSGSLFTMQKMGVSITYTEITVLVDLSVKNTSNIAENIFMLDGGKPSETEKNLLMETMNIMSGFNKLPVNVAASVYTSSIEFTVSQVYNEGSNLVSRYKIAGEIYEAIGTSVRPDLGDNIKKAFRNVDDLLELQGIEVNDENRRAARVLGYNSIEITVEAVETMGNIVSELDNLTKNLTPKAAVHLIRNGINPLNTNIEELNKQLVEINKEIHAEDMEEKYSEYLWKLERNKSISKEERDAYIQLYRIIEHINREDGRAAGSVAKAGATLTLANLYSAVKTMRAKSIDKTVDDDFGLLESGYSEDDLTKYMENVSNMMDDEGLHNEYKYERFIKKLDKVVDNETVSEQELMRITSSLEKTSINNIYSAMLAYDKSFYKAVKNQPEDKVSAELSKLESIWSLEDEDITEEHIVAGYENLSKAVNVSDRVDTFERSILRRDMMKTFSYMAKQAENKSYYVPMEIAGEETVVHMTFKEGGQKEKGKITIFAETNQGKVSVLIKRKAESYEVCAAVESKTLKMKLEALMDGKVVVSEQVLDGMWSDMYEENVLETNAEEGKITYSELVRQAKSFIHKVLKNI